MAHWLRFQYLGKSGFGQVQGDHIAVHAGDLFDQPQATGETLKLADVVIDIPCTPSKMVAMVDNFHALVTKLEHAVPEEPLYFLKGNNSFLAANQTIRTPKSYAGKVVYEGELGIVIGKPCHEAHETEAARAIFGYTCINDVTAIEILNRPLQAGDIIACGTSVGVGSMKPGSNVSIIIEGVGRLDNRFE